VKYCPKCKQTYNATERLCPNDHSVLSLRDPYHLVGRTLLDKYRIEALVGLGGMGAVYCAHHLGIDRRVAFKILQPNIAVNDEHIAELFAREAKVAGRLSHENIVDVKDAGRTADGLAYIVMEWLEGRTLEEELKETGRFGFARAAEILRQIAAALEEAHSKRIVHRDLKPANVMLVKRTNGSEQVKVLDFGIGKIIGETGSSVSAVMGTPSYASPEQLQLGGQIDARSDIYSLGVILYRILSGRLPFRGASVNELIQMQLTATPALLGTLRPELPVAIEQLVSRMLAKDPAGRPQSAREVAMLFDRVLASAETSGLETRLLAESRPSGETTIARALTERTTESMSEAGPPHDPKMGEGVPTTRPFTQVAAAQRASRSRSRLIPAALIGLAAVASGYGLYRYAFDVEQGDNGQETAKVAESKPAQAPSATPTQEVVATPGVSDNAGGAQSPTAPTTPQQDQSPPASVAARRMADLHFSQARELYNQGDYKAALSKTNEALKLNPQHRGALALRRKIRETIKILGER
jgi:serine/threonine-protein kinase